MALRKIRIVNDDPRGATHRTDVFDGETGEKLENVIDIELKVNRGSTTVIVTLFAGFEYEGVAEVRSVKVAADGSQRVIED